MDANQLAALLEAINTMATAMKNQQATISTPATATTTSVNVITNFDVFDPKTENFKTYKERLELHFQLKNVFDDKSTCAKLLLQYIGSPTYSVLSNIAAPKNVSELQYEEIIKLLESHFCPRKNILVEQHKFLSELQNENQSVSDFVSVLQQRSADCGFVCVCEKSVADIFLRAQFIRGIRDGHIREQLLQTPNASFRQIVEKATALEAAKVDNKAMSYGPSTSSSSAEINRIQKQTSNRRGRSRHRSQDRGRSSKSSVKIDYNQLGLKGMCLRCGRTNHLSNDCRIKKASLQCQSCGKIGHVQRVCIKQKLKHSTTHAIDSDSENSYDGTYPTDNFYGVNNVIDIYQKQSQISTVDTQKFYTTISIEGKNQVFEVDSGAGYTLIPQSEFDKLHLKMPLRKTNISFRTYTGDVFQPVGVVDVNVKYKNNTSKEELYVVSSKHTALLGRVWIRHLNINLNDIDLERSGNGNGKYMVNSIDKIMEKFSDIFEERVGCIPDAVCSLKLQEGAKPVFVRERQVPFALREKVEAELDSLERDGIITKVNTCNWGSPLVVIPKPDGNVRLCVDYKVAVNPQLVSAHYPIKRIDEIFNNLKNSKYFCKLDLYKAYLHVQVDDESKVIQAISTHRGVYRMNRLSFGIKTAPSEFNRILDQILQGLGGTISYFDDIIIHGESLEQCENRLVKCLERLKANNLHVNKNKCEYFKTKLKYLGYIVSYNKISKCPNKVKAIVELPKPQNVNELRRFLGMVTYYSKFIPDASTITTPLRKLLEEGRKFNWTPQCENAFTKVKEEIVADRVLVPYNESLPLTLACDASPTGIAAVLSHIVNGEERPIAFISRSLTKAEQNYSQLDREALAIIFGVDKFFNYLHGREFTLITDNRPLSRIFHQHAKTPAMTSSRLLRYASFLQNFNYKVVHRRGEHNTNADCLSRAPIESSSKFNHFLDEEVKNIQDQTINQISSTTVTAATIAKETDRDPELLQLKKNLLSGKNVDPSYSLQDGIVFRGDRVVIPLNLRSIILSELHHTHAGIVKMKQLARRFCFWKGIDAEIENLVKSCPNCAIVKKNPAKVITHQWEEPGENFQRVHIDYAGPFQNHYFFVLVDAKSKWPEVRVIREAPTTEKTIILLQNIFATHGLPQILVSDNATIFSSKIFKDFCSRNGIIQKFIAPGHPATNGLAERYVQTLKYKLKAMENDKATIFEKVQEIVYRYRATPLADGKSPALLYLGRELRIKLDAIRPWNKLKSSPSPIKVRQLSLGDRVQVRWYDKNKPSWKFGSVKAKFGNLHYQIKLDNGYELKRHINQIYKSNVEKPTKTVTFDLPPKPKPVVEEVRIECRVTNPANVPLTPATSSQQQTRGVSTPLRRSSRIRRPPAHFSDHIRF
ncbi:uncharacterized protein K02A2.6 isoform X1 [Haematobia irritans]|uniref:uncharacterized protein K02A2.6 isoform X1 n=1 Tax=Haematobia irritans TaxID=7368 RepID=UPI003F50B9FB